MIELGIITVVLALFLMWHLATAPLGYEDEDGFHEDD